MIPARMESSRFPNKAIAKINNREMLLRVLDRCKSKYNLYAVVNSQILVELASENGYKSILIDNICATGTDRIAKAVNKLSLDENDLIINVQGDEPLIDLSMIEKVIDEKIKYPEKVVNAVSSINSKEEFISKNVIKMVFSKNSSLLYASRSPIPINKKASNFEGKYKQTCIYGFSVKQLNEFASTKRGPLEKSEDIEILRFLENNLCDVSIVNLGKNNLHAVDHQEDIKIIENILNGK